MLVKEIEKENGRKRGLFKCERCGIEWKASFYAKGTHCKPCSVVEQAKKMRKYGDKSIRKDKLYAMWSNIKRRCYSNTCPTYKNYGAKNVVMCEEWKNSFDAFKTFCEENGYKDGLIIDRINPYGNYEPSNVRFVDKFISAQNKRTKTKTGVFGITETKNGFRGQICSYGAIYTTKRYKNIEDAIEARNEIIDKLNLTNTKSTKGE